MKNCKSKIGVTLVEMLIVVAVITLLVSMVVGIAARLDDQGKERLTENTFALVNAALGQFQDYGYGYKDYSVYPDNQREFYRGLDFPMDCNDLTGAELESELGKALDKVGEISITGGIHDPNYSGSEAVYFFLSQVPTSRQTLDKIDSSLITNENSDRQELEIKIGGRKYPLQRVIDPWGETLRYDYYDNVNEKALTWRRREKSKKNFPLITSAGPDRIFGTDDDMTNR